MPFLILWSFTAAEHNVHTSFTHRSGARNGNRAKRNWRHACERQGKKKKQWKRKASDRHGSASSVASVATSVWHITLPPLHPHDPLLPFSTASTGLFTSLISTQLLPWTQHPALLSFIHPWYNGTVLSPVKEPFHVYRNHCRHLQLLQLSELVDNVCFLNSLTPLTSHTLICRPVWKHTHTRTHTHTYAFEDLSSKTETICTYSNRLWPAKNPCILFSVTSQICFCESNTSKCGHTAKAAACNTVCCQGIFYS